MAHLDDHPAGTVPEEVTQDGNAVVITDFKG